MFSSLDVVADDCLECEQRLNVVQTTLEGAMKIMEVSKEFFLSQENCSQLYSVLD